MNNYETHLRAAVEKKAEKYGGLVATDHISNESSAAHHSIKSMNMSACIYGADLLLPLLVRARETLNIIRDPRLRHSEPDKYTELACVMNIADEALAEMDKLLEGK